eukprot:5535502-Pyramimonas_sp.AAC.1
MVHLWGYITGYGKKCKLLREALKCALDTVPDEHRQCYLKHISAPPVNETDPNTPCGWRPAKTAAGAPPSP